MQTRVTWLVTAFDIIIGIPSLTLIGALPPSIVPVSSPYVNEAALPDSWRKVNRPLTIAPAVFPIAEGQQAAKREWKNKGTGLQHRSFPTTIKVLSS